MNDDKDQNCNGPERNMTSNSSSNEDVKVLSDGEDTDGYSGHNNFEGSQLSLQGLLVVAILCRTVPSVALQQKFNAALHLLG